MPEGNTMSFRCSWCGKLVAGAPVMPGKAIVVFGNRAHYLRAERPARFERSEESEEKAA